MNSLNDNSPEQHTQEKVFERIRSLEDQIEYYKNEDNRQKKYLNGKLLILEAFQQKQSMADVYMRILNVVTEVTGFSSGIIHLVEPGEKFLYIVATKDVPEKYIKYNEIETLDRDSEEYFCQAQTSGIEGLENSIRKITDIHLDGQPILQDGVKMPLLAGDKLVGTLSLFNLNGHEGPLEAEYCWLCAIGRQVGILIDHIHISEQMQNAAVLLERERLSRELHDNLSQSIGTIRLLSERIVAKSEIDDYASIKDDAKIIETIAQDTYSSIRDEMIGLRLIKDQNQDIISMVRSYLKHYSKQWKIDTSLDITNLDEPSFIPPIISIQLIRIVQESLTNIYKHAHASRVVVSMEALENRLVVNIIDNGVGFDMNREYHNHFGLKIMSERAASLGGSVEISSIVELGTLVHIDLPMKIDTRV